MSTASNQLQMVRRQRRRGGVGGDRRRRRWGYIVPAAGAALTAAAVAYGTYQLASWAWKNYHGAGASKQRRQQEEGDDEEEEADGLLVGNRGTADDQLPSQQQQQQVRFRVPTHVHSSPPAAAAPSSQESLLLQQRQQHQWRLMRKHRMIRCRDETCAALQGFLSTVRRIMEEHTDTSYETKALKKLRAERVRAARATGGSSPDGSGGDDESGAAAVALRRRQEEQEMWDTIKIQSVTRMMVTAYAHTLLFLVLTVQVNLLGGRLFDEQAKKRQDGGDNDGDDDDVADRMASYQKSHKLVLTYTYQYFFEHGLLLLLHTIKRAVAETLHDWNVLDTAYLHTSRSAVEDGIRKVRAAIERDLDYRNARSSPRRDNVACGSPSSSSSSPMFRRDGLLRFLIPPTSLDDDDDDDEDDEKGKANEAALDKDPLARSILDETWDLLESPIWRDAQSDSLDATFQTMREECWGKAFEAPGTGGDEAEEEEEGDEKRLLKTLPLATILTKLKKAANSFYEPSPLKERKGSSDGSGSPPQSSSPASAQESPGAGSKPEQQQQKATSTYCLALQHLHSVRELADVSFN